MVQIGLKNAENFQKMKRDGCQCRNVVYSYFTLLSLFGQSFGYESGIISIFGPQVKSYIEMSFPRAHYWPDFHLK